ncbi:sugar-binding transcriptional regulator [Sporanaerobacter sp. PP17-6a]|jgi:central glycolytic genes regulator|uniref:sugar-binding transcriptional regulator n=1 Tax=Sporanaerobacter sp. PP17-6a TaxID=1891289 RepID=UPI00089F8C0D|nr:sugar-binding domain-containing protein [Sporanaerobacter sp. PP17-6a]MBE6081607.1 sugar-binding transcriptional regulator [Tissierellaceae bacterium]SCL89191.1 Central glycolytic genes regulator [Sporanaerobacter sp. PP17-6a]
MNRLIETEKKIVPEILEIMGKRYEILKIIFYHQPIGRRALANELKVGERVARTEVNILKEQGLIKIESMGMYLTEEGKQLLDDLKGVIYEMKGLDNLERKLEKALKIKKAIIVSGNCDEDELALKDMGKTTAMYLRNIINDNQIIGITGGSTMAYVAEGMPDEKKKEGIVVIPARGGLGERVETQANIIAAKLAYKLGGSYKLLHMPDNIKQDDLKVMIKNPEIKEIIDMIKKIDILVFGMGRADVMARRRNLKEETINELLSRGAVAEAFGHYFDMKGNIVGEATTVGLSLDDFNGIESVIGVGGGEGKAEAIISICSLKSNLVLITDEGAGRRILNLV